MWRLVRPIASVVSFAILLAGAYGATGQSCSAQDELIDRPDPPALDNLEADLNNDGIPDGWYNARNAQWMPEGGAVGPHFVRFECKETGRPARLSRAFGVDGRKTGAIVLGLWIRQKDIQVGEREGTEPSLFIDFLEEQKTKAALPGIRYKRHESIGPWTHSVHDGWTRVAKRISVPPSARDAIMSVGLMGATGTLDFDGLTVELIPVAGVETTNLIVNGDFELGDPSPFGWFTENGVRRVHPGFNSSSAIEMVRAKSRLMTGLAIEVEPFEALDITVSVRCSGLRGAGGAGARFFFLNDFGRPLPGSEMTDYCLRWDDTSAWRVDQAHVPVPRGAVRAVLQFDKLDSVGSIRIDDVTVTVSPNPSAGAWTPFHIADETEGWLPVSPSRSILPKSALDVSFLLPAPAGAQGFVSVKDGRLAFSQAGRARFFGVSVVAPTAFLEPEQADRLVDRLSRSGINLIRLGDLDTALGPNRSLYDDTRDDTKEFDPEALNRLDHLIAAAKKRGIYVAIELLSKRRFRVEDGVAVPGLLPSGGGPAALFDPTIRKLNLASARALLAHVNPETSTPLKNDPALAWVTLTGEISLFNLHDNPDSLPPPFSKALRQLAEKTPGGTGPRFWESVESAHFKQMASALRKDGLRAPIAGVSHWRREREFCSAQAGPGLDLIDDRLFWPPFLWSSPEMHSLLRAPSDQGLAAFAARKRRPDRPYVLGQWCNQTTGAWSFPHEAADQLLGVYTAMSGDWDAVVRRGIFVYPSLWGEGPCGTVGGDDIYQVAEVINGSPHIFALWPHAASLFLRGRDDRPDHDRQKEESSPRAVGKGRRRLVSGWDPSRDQLVIDTPYTQGVAGWWKSETASFPHLDFSTSNPFAVLMATSISDQPIATTDRLLVSAIARVEPTGFKWVSAWKREVADPGGPPFLQEPVRARILWRRKGTVRAYVLDNDGKRIDSVPVEPLAGNEGVSLRIDGNTAAFHWELTIE